MKHDIDPDPRWVRVVRYAFEHSGTLSHVLCLIAITLTVYSIQTHSLQPEHVQFTFASVGLWGYVHIINKL